VDAALDHLSANEPRKNAEASEKDAEPYVVELHDSGQNIGVFAYRVS